MEKLGIEPLMFLTQLINFVIIIVILTKFLYRPILKLLDERKQKIEEGLALSEKMKIAEEELKKERAKVLEKANDEGKDLIDEFKAQGKKVEADIISAANEEAKLLKEKTRLEMEEEKQKMKDELNKEVLSISLALTRTVLSQYLDKKTQMQIVEQKLKKLESERMHDGLKQ